jgi:hypothetical protein
MTHIEVDKLVRAEYMVAKLIEEKSKLEGKDAQMNLSALTMTYDMLTARRKQWLRWIAEEKVVTS